MTDFQSLTPDVLRQRGSMKWNRAPQDVLPMWVAEMDFPLADPVQRAIDDVVSRQAFGYAQVDQRAPIAFAGFARRRLGMEVNPDWTTVVPHVLSGIETALAVFTPPGAGVVVTTPAYMHFLVIPGLIGSPCVEVPLLEDLAAADVNQRWTLDLAGIEQAFAQGARSLILCQPYNPVAKVFSRDELSALADIVARHDGWVVSDEIHAPLTLPGVEHVAYAEVSETAASHCITVTSASKSFSMPGVQCATVTLHTEAAARRFHDQAPEDHLYGATTLGIECNIAAFTEGDEWLDGARAEIARNWERLSQAAEDIDGLRVTPGEATYLAWLDLREAGIGDSPAAWLREHGKLMLNEGSDFGAPGVGFARMNLATTQAIMDDGLARLRHALDQR